MTRPQFPDHPFTYADALRRGITRERLRRAVADGTIRRVATGVYVPAHLPDTAEVRASAFKLVISDYQVAVDRTAAGLQGVDVLTYAELDVPPPLEFCARRGHSPTDRSGTRGRERDLSPHDICVVHGLLVTTPLRTALDLGCNLRRREALGAMNALARKHRLTRAQMERELPRFRGRRGVVQLKQLVTLVDPRIESQLESWVFVEIRDAGLPLPVPQYWIVVDGIERYRLDFAYPHARVCVEYDGWEAHERALKQKERDAERRAWLRDHGWTVIVVRRGDFTGPGRDRWVRELTQALSPTYTNRRW